MCNLDLQVVHPKQSSNSRLPYQSIPADLILCLMEKIHSNLFRASGSNVPNAALMRRFSY